MDPLSALARAWISTRPETKSPAAWLASLEKSDRDRFLDGLSPEALAALPYLFAFWARGGHQLPPPPPWRTWLMLGGRGSGKTRAGAEWVRSQVEGATPLAPGAARRVALVAETWEQGRDVMVDGLSGLVACSPPDRRPVWVATRRKLVWVNGAEAQLFSAADPESLRGPQFDLAWCDELGKWRLGRDAWDMLQFGLRLGATPRQAVTTTPRDTALLREIHDAEGTVVTSAPTADNSAFLAPGFVEAMRTRYGDTALGRQELEGDFVRDPPDALFLRADIEAARVAAAPDLDRVVIGVDPPTTSGPRADECGIVVAGRAGDRIYVLADESVRAVAPSLWAARVVEAWRRWRADRIVAETNQGGEMVVETILGADPAAPVVSVRASKGKTLRAEPVSLLYARGRVRHVGAHPALEDQLCGFGPGGRSPDRMDALVWAVSDLMDDHRGPPRIRSL